MALKIKNTTQKILRGVDLAIVIIRGCKVNVSMLLCRCNIVALFGSSCTFHNCSLLRYCIKSRVGSHLSIPSGIFRTEQVGFSRRELRFRILEVLFRACRRHAQKPRTEKLSTAVRKMTVRLRPKSMPSSSQKRLEIRRFCVCGASNET